MSDGMKNILGLIGITVAVGVGLANTGNFPGLAEYKNYWLGLETFYLVSYLLSFAFIALVISVGRMSIWWVIFSFAVPMYIVVISQGKSISTGYLFSFMFHTVCYYTMFHPRGIVYFGAGWYVGSQTYKTHFKKFFGE